MLQGKDQFHDIPPTPIGQPQLQRNMQRGIAVIVEILQRGVLHQEPHEAHIAREHGQLHHRITGVVSDIAVEAVLRKNKIFSKNIIVS